MQKGGGGEDRKCDLLHHYANWQNNGKRTHEQTSVTHLLTQTHLLCTMSDTDRFKGTFTQCDSTYAV